MKVEKNFALREAINVNVDGATVKLSEVTLRRPRGREMMLIDKYRGPKGSDPGFDVVVATAAAVARISFDEASDLDFEDLVEISEIAVDFLPKEASKDQPEE